ncbi:MAG: adenine-specific methyltransferase EcoRI family protein [Bacteroidales bacterium]|nr:adenine-specific methyltransferase EcoRI family protein [Bacteroidales bacterium]
MAGNKSLHAASKAKQDEFYTQLSDIENELKHYKQHFIGKTILCNCDDPYESNFFKYFAMNFNQLGLKKLIATCYDGSPIADSQLSLFEVPQINKEHVTNKKAYKIEITEVKDENGDGAIDLADVEYLIKNNRNVLSLLEGNGDFRSEECIELLKQSDIVVTNPPFSLFRDFFNTLIKYQKSFIIIGSQNNITYKEVFPQIRDNKVWLGYKNGDMSFRVPHYYEPKESRYWQDENGQKWRSMGNTCWFTNLDLQKRHEEILLFKNYTPEDYPKYDNYEVIEVGHVADIPNDYYGVMGVPITFLDKHNFEQFEIIGMAEDNGKGMSGEEANWDKKNPHCVINGSNKYKRIFIRRKQKQYAEGEELGPIAAEK